MAPPFVTRAWSVPSRVVGLATTVYALVFSVLGADRYLTFHSGADLGLFVQTIASAFHGFSNTIEGTSHFAYHFSPILYLCAPLLWVTHSALALVFVQAAATASIAPALYAIARKRTSDARAAALACIALLYPPLQGVTFTDFHEAAFMPGAVAWLLWAIDARRFTAAALFLAIVLSIKEDQAVAMAFLGAAGCVYFARRGERTGTLFCVAAMAAATAVFASFYYVIRPMASAGRPWVPSHFYAWKGYAGGVSLAEQIVGRVTYLAEAFLPLALLPLRSPAILLAIPGFAEVLASREPLMYTMGQYYAATWVPYVLVAFVLAAARQWERSAVSGRRWVRAAAALCIVTSILFSPLHLGHFLRPLDGRDAAANALIAGLPESATIGTYDEMYSHLGFFPAAGLGVKNRPDFVLYDERYASAQWNGHVLPDVVRELRAGVYRTKANIDGVTLLERSSPF